MRSTLIKRLSELESLDYEVLPTSVESLGRFLVKRNPLFKGFKENKGTDHEIKVSIRKNVISQLPSRERSHSCHLSFRTPILVESAHRLLHRIRSSGRPVDRCRDKGVSHTPGRPLTGRPVESIVYVFCPYSYRRWVA